MSTALDAIRRFLTEHTVVTLASGGARPHAAAVYYAAEGLDLYCVSDPQTVHGSHMAAGEPLAGTIQDQSDDWKDIQGLQLHLGATAAIGPAADHATTLFVRRFPTAARLLDAPGTPIAFWRLRPTWIRLVDNRLGFGHKDEIYFAADGEPLEG